MKKHTILTFILFSWVFFCQALDLEKNWWYDFDGELGGTNIQLSIYLLDSGQFKGNYCYKKYETKIQLIGQITGDKIELTEFINGKVNGHFNGKIFTDNLDRFEGTWTNSLGEKKMNFKLTLGSACYSTLPDNRYSDFYGTDDDVEKFMKNVKKFILNGNKEWIATHVSYPIKTTLYKDKPIIIKNKSQLIENFDQIFHQEFKDKIKSFCVCNMFTNYQGVMLGNGQIWINNKPNSREEKFDYNITAIFN